MMGFLKRLLSLVIIYSLFVLGFSFIGGTYRSLEFFLALMTEPFGDLKGNTEDGGILMLLILFFLAYPIYKKWWTLFLSITSCIIWFSSSFVSVTGGV